MIIYTILLFVYLLIESFIRIFRSNFGYLHIYQIMRYYYVIVFVYVIDLISTLKFFLKLYENHIDPNNNINTNIYEQCGFKPNGYRYDIRLINQLIKYISIFF